MFNVKKDEIENFYVGELHLSYEFGNLLLLNDYTEESIKTQKLIQDTVLNGAINCNNLFSKYTDWEQRRFYQCLLTLFYKDGDEYVCLHNGQRYKEKGLNYYKNLVPLKDVLPRLSFKVPSKITERESLHLFKYLYNKKERELPIGMYTKDQYNMSDFYLGVLNFCEGFIRKNFCRKDKDYEQYNLAEKQLLFKSDAVLIGGSSTNSQTFKGCYDYLEFKTLFLKLNDGNFYNLHNFRIYPQINSHEEKYQMRDTGLYYCDSLKPFGEELEAKNIEMSEETTIPKVLKLYKKIK